MKTSFEFASARIASAFTQQLKLNEGNKYILLYKAIKNCILKEEIPQHWIIPSTRSLSETLGLSRTTVIKAYELLMLENLMIAKAGSGFRVRTKDQFDNQDAPSKLLDKNEYPAISEKGEAFLNNISILNRQPNTAIAFKPGLPPIDIFPINQWKNLLNTYWRYIKASDLSYGQSTGSALLKTQICNYLNVSRNLRCTPEQVIIVSGSLQSIYLLAGALVNKGDAVVVEDPTFPNVHSIFKSNLANLIPIPIDDEGISLTALQENAKSNPKLIHVTPSDHYPLGIKMSLKRRLELLAWASANHSYIIENDYEHEIGNLTHTLPTLFSLDKESRTIYLGTFNRLLYPSIRLGYMILPTHLVPVIEALQEHSHRFVSPSVQLVMGQFIEKNYLFQHLKNLKEIAQERAAYFLKQFEEGNQIMHINNSDINSLHLVAHFNKPKGIGDERNLIQALEKQDLSVYSLSKCYIQAPPRTGFILGYSTVGPVLIKQKVRQLIHAIQDK